ncbi:hypothetical protein [Bacillus sp. 03113]
MNSEMQFSPHTRFQEKQAGNPDERIFGRPSGSADHWVDLVSVGLSLVD